MTWATHRVNGQREWPSARRADQAPGPSVAIASGRRVANSNVPTGGNYREVAAALVPGRAEDKRRQRKNAVLLERYCSAWNSNGAFV